MRTTKDIKPWEIAFCVIYYGRHSLFANQELVHTTLTCIARLQGIEYYPPEIPAILAESADKALQDGSEIWIEHHCFRSGQNPLMPRYMFGRQILGIFQKYGEKTEEAFSFYQMGIAEMHRFECPWNRQDD